MTCPVDDGASSSHTDVTRNCSTGSPERLILKFLDLKDDEVLRIMKRVRGPSSGASSLAMTSRHTRSILQDALGHILVRI